MASSTEGVPSSGIVTPSTTYVATAPAAALSSISQSQISPSSQTATSDSAVSSNSVAVGNVSIQAAAQSSSNTGTRSASVQLTTTTPSKAGSVVQPSSSISYNGKSCHTCLYNKTGYCEKATDKCEGKETYCYDFNTDHMEGR
ncbi:Hypothetical predicted protein [Paramuricea clavata]|uniref:Uncharacterized protein n=1 Tax=Paramuricea clavata TaxID=317549 RepID=A0A7D9EDP7_PARCT|nr:Hypothetical predicted protein [Paramuricea clavata]